MIDKRKSAVTGDDNREKTVIERTYRATVAELWDLWTTKQGFESWWGPEEIFVEVHVIEARQGGALNYDMVAGTPEMIEAMKQMGQPVRHGTRGTFSEFNSMARLTLTHVIDFLPGVDPYESTIEVEFHPAGEFVRMVVTLYGMHDEEFTKMQIEGFTSQLSKLDKRYDQQS